MMKMKIINLPRYYFCMGLVVTCYDGHNVPITSIPTRDIMTSSSPSYFSTNSREKASDSSKPYDGRQVEQTRHEKGVIRSLRFTS